MESLHVAPDLSGAQTYQSLRQFDAETQINLWRCTRLLEQRKLLRRRWKQSKYWRTPNLFLFLEVKSHSKGAVRILTANFIRLNQRAPPTFF